jgi:predicted AlkP superfamily pyrophosphatase or phosphodiesterase
MAKALDGRSAMHGMRLRGRTGFVRHLKTGTVLALSLLMLGAAPATSSSHHKLLVISVDGLDWRYLRDADAMGLAIPNLRRLMAQGEVAQGVIGVWPTVTWPSHTSIITGRRPDEHGILNNQRPLAEGGDYYWTPDLLHAPTLWACAGEHGLRTASVTWPVTTGGAITYDIPEYFHRRNGGSMDLESIASKATPALVAAITRAYPSFPQQWMDDRTRTLATLYLLGGPRPDLILLHLVDLDSEEHDQGPFEANAKAVLERTDELIGQMTAALPANYDLVITSDHGFERLDHIAEIKAMAKAAGVTGDLRSLGGLAVTKDAAVAAWLRAQAGRPGGDVGREVPPAELRRYAPGLAVDGAVAFEPADHVMFGRADDGPAHTPPREKGEHGFFPTRHDYRSVFILSGPGTRAGSLGEVEMVSLKDRLAAVLGLSCP